MLISLLSGSIIAAKLPQEATTLSKYTTFTPNIKNKTLAETGVLVYAKGKAPYTTSEFKLDFFGNDRYELLVLLCDNQIKVKDDFYIPLSQQEIADIAHYSKLKTNRLLNELMDAGFLAYFNGKRGKYVITERGHKALHLMQKNNV